MVIVIGVVVGFVTGAFGSLTGEKGATNESSGGGSATVGSTQPSLTASVTPTATPTVAPAGLPRPVLVPAEAGHLPNAVRLAARIGSVHVKDVKGRNSGAVVDLGTGKLLFAQNASTALIPASTMKLLTTTVALSVLGPEHRFSTRVVSLRRGAMVLVGGGDPYLASRVAAGVSPRPATTAELAAATAARLKADKITQVSLGYDGSLFSGPSWNRLWPDEYRDQVSKMSALWVDEGRVSGSPGPRVRDPAKTAATTFAKALNNQGIRVTKVAPARAPESAQLVASVRSLPLERIVEQLLLASDNDAAEVLLRQIALASGRPGTIDEGVRAVRARLAKLGAWDPGAVLDDGSGLARQNRIPAGTMVKVLRLAASDQHPELRAVITGLPVAGVEGSLRTRFFDDASLAGRGVVRAKTGTLRDVHTLAGVLRTSDGSLLAFAFLINNPKNQFNATIWLDRVTTAISTCGCG
jgi:D-alanyl-D-alanine carboxypeptidase/D-alanyl-D-alanine-endopeptidase (penicillin-binding protein 4)